MSNIPGLPGLHKEYSFDSRGRPIHLCPECGSDEVHVDIPGIPKGSFTYHYKVFPSGEVEELDGPHVFIDPVDKQNIYCSKCYADRNEVDSGRIRFYRAVMVP